MTLHLELAAAVEDAFGSHLADRPTLTQDALLISLPDGVVVTVRYAAPDAYSLRWVRAGHECGIDTAPVHRGLGTFPNHMHDAAGSVQDDPLTDPAAPPAENVSRLLERLIADPGFGM